MHPFASPDPEGLQTPRSPVALLARIPAGPPTRACLVPAEHDASRVLGAWSLSSGKSHCFFGSPRGKVAGGDTSIRLACIRKSVLWFEFSAHDRQWEGTHFPLGSVHIWLLQCTTLKIPGIRFCTTGLHVNFRLIIIQLYIVNLLSEDKFYISMIKPYVHVILGIFELNWWVYRIFYFYIF